MTAIVIRIILGAALFLGGVTVVDRIFDADILGAIGRVLLWFWRGIVEFLARLVGVFSKSFAVSVKSLAQKTILRRVSRLLWRFAIVGVGVLVLGQVAHDKIEAWLTAKQSRALSTLNRMVRFKPEWPRGVRALIALFVIGAFAWAFLWINANIGMWWGLGASVALWMLVEKVQIIGFDALASFLTEKWAPARAFLERHTWIRWLWFGPVFSWLAQSAESLKEAHARRYDGKSSLVVWFQKLRSAKKQGPPCKMSSPGVPETRCNDHQPAA
jgi:hypothetical protein